PGRRRPARRGLLVGTSAPHRIARCAFRLAFAAAVRTGEPPRPRCARDKQAVRRLQDGGRPPDLLVEATELAPTAIAAIRGLAPLGRYRGRRLCARRLVELRARRRPGNPVTFADADVRRLVRRDVAVERPQADARARSAACVEARPDDVETGLVEG